MAIELEERIKYWRGRAALARRFGLKHKAEVAEKIVAVLVEHRKTQRVLDERVDRLAEDMPQELYTG